MNTEIIYIDNYILYPLNPIIYDDTFLDEILDNLFNDIYFII